MLKFNPLSGQFDLVGAGGTGAVVIPEYTADPPSPSPGDTWVLKTSTFSPQALSHTLLQIGLTAPGGSVVFSYQLKYRTLNNTTVAVALT